MLLFLGLSVSAQAEQALAPTVVSATGTEESSELASERVWSVSAAEIKASNAHNVQEALLQLPGVHALVHPATQAFSQLSMQGMGGEYIKILVDGIEVSGDISGAVPLEQIPVDDIERIEVLQGAASALYGSDALGGVIQIITHSRQGPQGLHLQASEQIYSTLRTYSDAAVQWRKGKALLRIGASWDRDGGSTFDTTNAFGKSVSIYPMPPVLNLAAHASADWYEDHSAYGLSARVRQNTKTIRDVTLFESAYHDQEFALEANTKQQTSARSDLDANISAQGFIHQAQQENLTFTTKLPMLQSVFLDGRSNINWVMRYSQWNQWVVSTSASLQTLQSPDFPERMQDANLDVSVQDLIWLDSNARYELVPGLRFSSLLPVQQDHFDAIITPKLSTRVMLAPHLVARASYGMGYRRPTLKQKYWELFHQAPFNFLLRGNPDLKPEQSQSTQGSLQWKPFEHLTLCGGAFYNALSNMITDAMIDSIPGIAIDRSGVARPYVHIRTYVNKKRAFTTGGDLSLEYESEAWNVGISYTRLVAKEHTDQGDSDLILQVPHSCKGHVAYTLPTQSTLRIQGTWNSAQLVSAAPRLYSPDQILFDVSLAQKLGKHFDLSLGIDNVLDNWNAGQEAYYGLFDGRVYQAGIQAHY